MGKVPAEDCRVGGIRERIGADKDVTAAVDSPEAEGLEAEGKVVVEVEGADVDCRATTSVEDTADGVEAIGSESTITGGSVGTDSTGGVEVEGFETLLDSEDLCFFALGALDAEEASLERLECLSGFLCFEPEPPVEEEKWLGPDPDIEGAVKPDTLGIAATLEVFEAEAAGTAETGGDAVEVEGRVGAGASETSKR